ncbi:MAG TPA: hypothetical protein PK971_01625 [Saprospiraceae bacterium]|nr:hypothetical protein [Saprospiraceae bacterium]HND86992.1 hypothetical protein [Saprospiraceae bacterium]
MKRLLDGGKNLACSHFAQKRSDFGHISSLFSSDAGHGTPKGGSSEQSSPAFLIRNRQVKQLQPEKCSESRAFRKLFSQDTRWGGRTKFSLEKKFGSLVFSRPHPLSLPRFLK